VWAVGTKSVPKKVMKKFFVSVGLAAAGVAGVQMAQAGVDSKDWSVSASLRGFYDDNYSTAPNKTGSYGIEFSPEISVSVPLQQTEIGLRYTYGLYYYQQRDEIGVDAIDQSHQIDVWLDHAFDERWHGRVSDTFVVGQEPALLSPVPAGSPPGTTTLPYRVKGDNIANTALFTLDTDWTRELSTELSYQNNFYDYQNSGGTTNASSASYILGPLGPSLAGLLNRDEQLVALNLQWHIASQTMAYVGYQFEQVNYLGDEPVAFTPFLTMNNGFYYSKDRDNRSHYFYVGIQHNLLANLAVSARVGGTYTEYYNDPLSSPSTSPYAEVSATYTYMPGSYAQIGFSHVRNATDVINPSTTNGRITQDQESSMLYASINQHITPKFLATIIGSWQYSTFYEGAFDNQSDKTYSVGLNLNYAFTKHFSAETGYNYDNLQSGIAGRGYSRNRVYLGVAAAF
jgi:Putative beta-barrel porin 2